MNRAMVVSLAWTFSLAFVFSEQACAQQGRLPHETQRLQYTGAYKWVVYLNSTDLNFRRQPVADFPTPEQAEATRDRLNKALPLSSPHFYQVDERPRDGVPFSLDVPPSPAQRSVPRVPSAPALEDTTWVGSETANDTTNLQFVFKANGEVLAYDDTRHVWRGRWRKTSDTTVIINLTHPRAINYYGTINGGRISGTARTSGGGWRWSVTMR